MECDFKVVTIANSVCSACWRIPRVSFVALTWGHFGEPVYALDNTCEKRCMHISYAGYYICILISRTCGGEPTLCWRTRYDQLPLTVLSCRNELDFLTSSKCQAQLQVQCLIDCGESEYSPTCQAPVIYHVCEDHRPVTDRYIPAAAYFH